MKEIESGTGQEIIQFAHANAYVPECYRQMVESFDLEKYKFFLPELRPLWKDSRPERFRSWYILADDLIHHMDDQNRKDVIGMGHSMGAVATWLASIKRPDLFKHLILIDPVILPWSWVFLGQYINYRLKKEYVPILKIALKRRDQWADKNEVLEHLGKKKIYQRFHPSVWEDFINYGIVQNGNKATLRYPKQWEARIYGTAPNLWPLISKSKVPLTIIKGEYSDVITKDTWQKLHKRMPNAKLVEMKGVGHLLPFEKPNELSSLVSGVLSDKEVNIEIT